MKVLDKSLEYADIIMVLKWENICNVPKPIVPEGFTLRTYVKGDIKYWAEIEASVEEFENKKDAVKYFKKEYMRDKKGLEKRLVFACSKSGVPVANSFLWYRKAKKDVPMIHWVATMPNYQNAGLGKAVVTECINISKKLHYGQDIYLHTQTWSHKAIQMYYGMGFRLVKSNVYDNWKNDYYKAVAILNNVYDADFLHSLQISAVK